MKKIKIPFKYNPTSWFLKGKEKEIAQAKYELKGTALDKKLADIDEKPFVTVLNTHFDPNNPKQGYFELDWNEPFVAMLRENGYEGSEEEMVVDKWFSDLCKTIVREEIEDEYDLLGEAPNIVQLKDGRKIIE